MYNLRSPETQAKLSRIPCILQGEAIAYAHNVWAHAPSTEKTPCPYKPINLLPKPQITVAVKAGLIVAYTCEIILSHGWYARAAYVDGRYDVAVDSMMRSHLITLVQRAGTCRTLKWYNNKWMNAEY